VARQKASHSARVVLFSPVSSFSPWHSPWSHNVQTSAGSAVANADELPPDELPPDEPSDEFDTYAAKEPDELAADEPEPAMADEPEPSSEPLAAEELEAFAADEPADEPEALTADEPDASAADEPEAPATDGPEPSVADEPVPLAAEKPEASAAGEPEPLAAEEPESSEADEPEPLAVEEPDASSEADEPSDEFDNRRKSPDTETPAGQSSQVTGHSARACPPLVSSVQYSAINAQLATPPSVAADTPAAAESAHTLPNVADHPSSNRRGGGSARDPNDP
jgi:hypothetical protein